MTDIYADWRIVVPGEGSLKETAKELLALAGDPSLVRTAGNGTMFLVPAHVADAYSVPSTPAPVRRRRSKKTEDVIEDGD